jgi:hypothetical protein
MNTLYPSEPIKDYDEWKAYVRSERIRILSSKAFNRLKITEAITSYNKRVQVESLNKKLSSQQLDYRRRNAMSKLRLAAEVLPEYPIGAAKSYISYWDNGSRITGLSPARISLIAKVLQCEVSDLFEVVN